MKYKGCKLSNNFPLDLKSIISNKLFNNTRRLKFSSDADNVRLTNACVTIIIINKLKIFLIAHLIT